MSQWIYLDGIIRNKITGDVEHSVHDSFFLRMDDRLPQEIQSLLNSSPDFEFLQISRSEYLPENSANVAPDVFCRIRLSGNKLLVLKKDGTRATADWQPERTPVTKHTNNSGKLLPARQVERNYRVTGVWKTRYD